jgi:hypothetical protein
MKKRTNKNKELTYMDIKDMDIDMYMQEFGFGGWMKKNWANVATGVGGLALATLGGPAGMAAGIGMMGQSVSGFKGTADQDAQLAEQNANNAQLEQQSKLAMANQRIQQTDNPMIQSPGNFKCGGRLKKYAMGGEMMTPNVSETALFREYNGRSHDDGGINVGVNGNVVLPGERPIAEVEGKENVVMIDGEPYIMPDALKYDKNNSFADINKKDAKKYGLNNKDRGMIKSVDPITKKGYEKITKQRQEELEKLKQVIDLKNNRTQVLREQVGEFRTGGNLPKYGPGGGFPPVFGEPWEINNLNRIELEKNLKDNLDYSTIKTHIPRMQSKNTPTEILFKPFLGDYEGLNNISEYNHSSQLPVANTNNMQQVPLPSRAALPQEFGPEKMQPMVSRPIPTNNLPTNTMQSIPTVQMADLPIETPEGKAYRGMGWGDAALSAIPGLAGAGINLVRANNLQKPDDVYFGRMTPQQINLQRERDAAIEQANLTRSNASRGLRNNTGSVGQYLANIGSTQTGIGRGLSQQLGRSYQQEELTNAQMRQQANMTNLDLGSKETMYNQQQDTQYNNAKRGMYGQAISQGLGAITGAINDKTTANQMYDRINMMNPNYSLEQNGNSWFQAFQTPRKRVKNYNLDNTKVGQYNG